MMIIKSSAHRESFSGPKSEVFTEYSTAADDLAVLVVAVSHVSSSLLHPVSIDHRIKNGLRIFPTRQRVVMMHRWPIGPLINQ